MADPIKDPPAATGGGEGTGAGAAAAAAQGSNTGDEAAKAAAAQAQADKLATEAAAKAETDKAAAQAAAKAEADKAAAEAEKNKLTPEQKAEAEKAKAAEEASKAEKEMKAGWEKLRKEGIELTDEQLLSVENYAKAEKLDAAQKMLIIKNQQTIFSAQKQQWEAIQKQWIDSLKADKEFGGANFARSVEGAHRVAQKFGDPEFLQTLEDTKMGNLPGYNKMLARIHRALMATDTFVPNTSQGEPPPPPKTKAQILFPNSDPDQEAKD